MIAHTRFLFTVEILFDDVVDEKLTGNIQYNILRALANEVENGNGIAPIGGGKEDACTKTISVYDEKGNVNSESFEDPDESDDFGSEDESPKELGAGSWSAKVYKYKK